MSDISNKEYMDLAKVFKIRYERHGLFDLEVSIVRKYLKNQKLSIFKFMNRLHEFDEELYEKFVLELNKESGIDEK